MSTTDDLATTALSVDPSLTSEGRQELSSRDVTDAAERLIEAGAVLRMSEAESQQLASQADEVTRLESELDDAPVEETMIINMGPQHPSTHGVLRLMLELQGEKVLRCKPIIGYLHTGMEWTGEELTYLQGCTNVTRMDYASPLFSELAFSLTVEKLLGVEVPERAVWIRMLMTELNRISSHLLFMATNGMDIGAISMMLYGWREREEVLRFLEMVTGLRMNHNYIRPGGVAADLPDGWRDEVMRLVEMIPPRLDEYDTLLTGQPIWRERLQGVGVIDTAVGDRPRHDRADPAGHRLRLGPASRPALPGLRPGRLRRDRRHVRRLLRPLRHPAQRDPRVACASSPRSSTRCLRATGGCRTRR